MRKKRSIEKHYSKWGYIFAIPFVAAFLIFHLWPMANTFLYAFCDLKHTEIVEDPPLLVSEGLPWYKNFQDLLGTKSFWDALKNTAVFWIAQTIPEWILAFWLAATMTDRRLKIKGKWLFKTAFFFPNLMTGSTLGYLVINNIYLFIGSTVSFLLAAASINGFGVTIDDFMFFFSPQFLVVAVSIFVHFGITYIYTIVGVTSIPVEIFEAAEMDGSSRLHTFFHITLPCMKPIMFFIVILSVVDGLAMSEIPSLLGNPYDSLRRTLTLMTYLQNIFGMGSAYDRASAFCLILLLISASISGIVYLIFIRDRSEAELKKIAKANKKAGRLET